MKGANFGAGVGWPTAACRAAGPARLATASAAETPKIVTREVKAMIGSFEDACGVRPVPPCGCQCRPIRASVQPPVGHPTADAARSMA